MYIEDIIAACRRILEGDEDALQQLRLDTTVQHQPHLAAHGVQPCPPPRRRRT